MYVGRLAGNPVCLKVGHEKGYCSAIQRISSYSTPQKYCYPPCDHGKEMSPECHCAYPFTGTLYFRSPSLSGLSNHTNFVDLQQNIWSFFNNSGYPVESVAIRNIREDATDHRLLIDLLLFPLVEQSFNQTGRPLVGSVFSKQIYKPPKIFGPYYFNTPFYGRMKPVTQ